MSEPQNLNTAKRFNLNDLPEPAAAVGEVRWCNEQLFTAAQMLAIRDQGVAYGIEAAIESLAAKRSALIRLAEEVEAAGYRRGLAGKAPSDYEPEICALVNAIDAAIRSKAVQNTVQVSGKEGV
jgi:hypothetical protein